MGFFWNELQHQAKNQEKCDNYFKYHWKAENELIFQLQVKKEYQETEKINGKGNDGR
jgi:predicted transposase YbfD/YdcC